MLKMIKNYLMLFLNLSNLIITFILLFVISFVNIENIFQFNFSDLFTVIYFLYLITWISLLIFSRFIKINNNVLRDEVLYTVKFIFFISALIIPSFFINHSFILEHLSESNLYLRSYWRIAFLYFALALVVSPVLRFIKNIKIRDNLIFSRKILWILSFIFFLKHWLEYFGIEYIFQSQYHANTSYLKYVYDNMLIRYDALSWFVAWILMLILWITSNKISIKIFWGKWWKLIQSLVYPAFLISTIHVAFSSRFDNFYSFLLVSVILMRSISYFSNKTEQNKWETTKYICIPCWYIYDENIWDPDSWIVPGTKFKDIPDYWTCPVCWVKKTDFEPYYDMHNTIISGWYLGIVISYTMLTEDILEISLKLDENIEILKWQYSILTLKDFDWEFSRAYSIVNSKDWILTFCIKLTNTWRWWKALLKTKLWDTIKVKWIYWDFVLHDTVNQKVFIATWTWLAPIINMISTKFKSENNHLFFWVPNKKDLFYLEKINNIENLNTHIYLSKEEVPDYNYWRIDLSKFEFEKDAEFYICWNPWVVAASKEFLLSAWYKNIFFEKFN